MPELKFFMKVVNSPKNNNSIGIKDQDIILNIKRKNSNEKMCKGTIIE